MKAVVYKGTGNVAVEEVSGPKIAPPGCHHKGSDKRNGWIKVVLKPGS